jgi:hypothetical protein
LDQLIAVNAEFEVLLCVSRQCCKAVSPAGTVEHLRKFHKEKPAVRNQVREFVAEIPWVYDYASIKLPANGSAPQPAVSLRSLQCGFLARKFLGTYRASPKHASITFFDLCEAANTVFGPTNTYFI